MVWGRPRAMVASAIVGVAVLLLVCLGSGFAPKRVTAMTFPHWFLFGAATSAYQVEGGNTNADWYEWENSGKTAYHAGLADDEYHLYKEDFALAHKLGHNAFRMSIEWSRIEPSQGQFSESAIEHYRKEIEAAHANGLKVFVTLHHFTNPIWAAHQGAWLNPKMPIWFEQYVRYVVPRLGDLVDYWLTINEPNVYALTGYVVGATPPGIKNINDGVKVLAQLLKAHAYAYHVIHSYFPNARVGFAHHMRVFVPYRWWNPGDVLASKFIDQFWNVQILDAIKTGKIDLSIPFLFHYTENFPELKGALDFLGVNYYTRDRVKLDLSSPEKFALMPPPKNADVSDMGWEIYPQGLYRSLQIASSYGWPVYITENGIADASDSKRARFICDHLSEVAQAIADGMDVRGYLYWALIDNYEWVDGFGPRFGLIAIDYATEKRTIRPSAWVYAKIIRSHSLKDACRYK